MGQDRPDMATSPDLERRLRLPYAAVMIGANVVGALIVFAVIRFVLPLPEVDDPAASRRDNLVAFAAYLAVSLPAGTLWVLHRLAPLRAWLRAGRPASPAEQRAVLLAPAREVEVHAALWAAGAILFTALNARAGFDLALIVAVTTTLGAAATCAVAYLLAQRILRPVAALALAGDVPDDPALPGIRARLLLTWGLGTGVPVLGMTLVGLGQLAGVVHASPDRLAAAALALGAVALLVSLGVAALTARSLADSLAALRAGLDRVQRGDTDARVAVDDGSEVGLVQAGFNRMAAGLGERERLRDLFDRQVGRDVASRALERGAALGGEEREVAVLFVDLVGSTELAHERRPAEVVELLNAFFDVVVAVVAHERGTVNKFVGDAALCVFGAPADHPDAAGAALRAARGLHARLAIDLPGMAAGIGVSAGTVVAGNIGAAQRYEYTVVGDAVNEAARLTELAKGRGGVLAAQAALDRAGDEAAAWALAGRETLRGRAAPTGLAAPTSAPRAGRPTPEVGRRRDRVPEIQVDPDVARRPLGEALGEDLLGLGARAADPVVAAVAVRAVPAEAREPEAEAGDGSERE